MNIVVRKATHADLQYAQAICDEMEESAKKRGTGIAKRDPEYIKKKMNDENSVIAFVGGKIAGFSYIEVYDDGEFVANSGLIVFPEFRALGIAKKIKKEIFKLSRSKFKKAKIVSITTSAIVMKMNTDLDFKPVTFSELPVSDRFWNGCKSCVNYEILMKKDKKVCLCTGLLYDPEKNQSKIKKFIQKWQKK